MAPAGPRGGGVIDPTKSQWTRGLPLYGGFYWMAYEDRETRGDVGLCYVHIDGLYDRELEITLLDHDTGIFDEDYPALAPQWVVAHCAISREPAIDWKDYSRSGPSASEKS